MVRNVGQFPRRVARSGIHRFLNWSNSGTVKSTSPRRGAQWRDFLRTVSRVGPDDVADLPRNCATSPTDSPVGSYDARARNVQSYALGPAPVNENSATAALEAPALATVCETAEQTEDLVGAESEGGISYRHLYAQLCLVVQGKGFGERPDALGVRYS